MAGGYVPEMREMDDRNVANYFCLGATKVKLAAPKSKYIEHLLMATQVR